MQVVKSVAGVNSLRRLAATGSSSRVLDLHALAVEKPTDPDYLERPLFAHPLLNRSIIVKHNLHWSDVDKTNVTRLNATKIIFPFDQSDLSLGGQAMFVGQKDLAGVLTRHLDYTDLPLGRDLTVLLAMDKLPTLDPFLVSEILIQKGIRVGRCYFRFSKGDKAAMLAFVSSEIEALILSCFGETKANDKRARRLSQLLLSDHRSPDLEPLRATFRMSEGDFSEAMFAWKAFLYYRWRSRALALMLKSTLKSVTSIDALRYRRGELAFVIKAKPMLQRNLINTWREVGRRLRLYDKAFASLTDQENPDAFTSFLIQGSRLFVELGDRVGRLEHAVSFWNDRFGGERLSALSPEEVLDGMRDLLQALSIQVGALSKWSDADRRARARELISFRPEAAVVLSR